MGVGVGSQQPVLQTLKGLKPGATRCFKKRFLWLVVENGSDGKEWRPGAWGSGSGAR